MRDRRAAVAWRPAGLTERFLLGHDVAVHIMEEIPDSGSEGRQTNPM